MSMMPAQYRADSRMPGPMPPMNRAPMEVSVSTPNRMSSRLGGMSMPSTEDPVTTPTAKDGL